MSELKIFNTCDICGTELKFKIKSNERRFFLLIEPCAQCKRAEDIKISDLELSAKVYKQKWIDLFDEKAASVAADKINSLDEHCTVLRLECNELKTKNCKLEVAIESFESILKLLYTEIKNEQ